MSLAAARWKAVFTCFNNFSASAEHLLTKFHQLRDASKKVGEIAGVMRNTVLLPPNPAVQPVSFEPAWRCTARTLSGRRCVKSVRRSPVHRSHIAPAAGGPERWTAL